MHQLWDTWTREGSHNNFYTNSQLIQRRTWSWGRLVGIFMEKHIFSTEETQLKKIINQAFFHELEIKDIRWITVWNRCSRTYIDKFTCYCQILWYPSLRARNNAAVQLHFPENAKCAIRTYFIELIHTPQVMKNPLRGLTLIKVLFVLPRSIKYGLSNRRFVLLKAN